MKAFAELFQRLEVEKNNGKVAALASYFHQAEDLDAATFPLFFSTSRR